MTRALVLSGGGPVGIAWETAMAAGLARRGVNLADADFIVGTSAGSAVGAQIALGRDMDDALRRYQEASSAGERPDAAPAQRQGMAERMAGLMQVMAEAMASDAPPEESRAAIGRFALDADTGPEENFVDFFRYLRGEEWPGHYACTAVDTETGEFVVWDVKSGVDLDRAVASSCAVPGIFPPITLKGRRYIDGGMRSGTNADLAKGYDKVLILTLITGARASAMPAVDPRLARYRERSDAELGVLTESGSEVEVVGPDEETSRALGFNLMDASLSFTAADAGLRQGEREAPRLTAFWS